MIAKAFVSVPGQDRFQRAGDAAERQMAHYLDRAFAQRPDVQVFHNVRVQHGKDVAQIDHLVLHAHGLVIIESKSVTTRVRINARGEWSREYAGKWSGMPSPELQGRRQADLLLKLLDAHAAQLIGTLLGVQKRFGAFRADVLVAVSDGGLIERATDHANVHKADQIPQRVSDLMRDRRGRNSVLHFWEAGLSLSEPEVAAVTRFLKARHRDRAEKSAQPRGTGEERRVQTAPIEAVGPVTGRHGTGKPVTRKPEASAPAPGRPGRSTPPPAARCRHCPSTRLTATSGPYGAYFRCQDCQQNTRMVFACPKCQGATSVRQDAGHFHAECRACGHTHRVA